MTIDETKLTKGQLRKLNALRKSVGDALGEEAFGKWLAHQATLPPKSKPKPDPVAVKIIEAFAGLESDPKFRLGNYGYTIRRVKGRGTPGFIATKNTKTG